MDKWIDLSKAQETLADCFEEVEKERDQKLEEAEEPYSWYKVWIRGKDEEGLQITSEYKIKDQEEMTALFVAILDDVYADPESRKAWDAALNIRAALLRQGFNGAIVD